MLLTLLEFWPYGNTAKEIGYIITIYESLDFLSEIDDIDEIVVPLFKRVAQCLASEHVQIIDKTMTFFEKDNILNLARTHAKVIYPLIVPAIEKQYKGHWHKTLRENFKDLRAILKETNNKTYEAV